MDSSLESLGEHKLNHLRFILSLRRHGPTHCADAAKQMKISSAAVTGVKDRFALLGMISEDRDDPDRRKVTISLTRKGEELADRFQRYLDSEASK